METKTDVGAVPTVLVCACVLFFPLLWGLFGTAGGVTVYFSILLLIAVLHVLIMRKGLLRLGPPLLLALGGLFFALSNGVVEELIFRGVLWDALRGAFSQVIAAVLVQAALFGLWHWKGFPGGPSGMTLVFVWGLFLGWIRSRSDGMLAPFISHVCADLTIFSILSILARR
jgi:hypothetical protein